MPSWKFFVASYKVELIYQKTLQTRREAQRDIFEYIEIFYNREGVHSSLGYYIPEEMRVDVNQTILTECLDYREKTIKNDAFRFLKRKYLGKNEIKIGIYTGLLISSS